MKIAVSFFAGWLVSSPAFALGYIEDEQSYNGHIELHNQVEYHTIRIFIGQGNLRVWTDSYGSGANFDPIIALGHNGELVAQNDDTMTVKPLYQGKRDAGLVLNKLPIGTYVVTITAYPNFPRTTHIGDGFAYDNVGPIPIEVWCQPAHVGIGCHVERHFSLHWSVE